MPLDSEMHFQVFVLWYCPQYWTAGVFAPLGQAITQVSSFVSQASGSQCLYLGVNCHINLGYISSYSSDHWLSAVNSPNYLQQCSVCLQAESGCGWRCGPLFFLRLLSVCWLSGMGIFQVWPLAKPPAILIFVLLLMVVELGNQVLRSYG
jgi:hypothetical protein